MTRVFETQEGFRDSWVQTASVYKKWLLRPWEATQSREEQSGVHFHCKGIFLLSKFFLWMSVHWAFTTWCQPFYGSMSCVFSGGKHRQNPCPNIAYHVPDSVLSTWCVLVHFCWSTALSTFYKWGDWVQEGSGKAWIQMWESGSGAHGLNDEYCVCACAYRYVFIYSHNDLLIQSSRNWAPRPFILYYTTLEKTISLGKGRCLLVVTSY